MAGATATSSVVALTSASGSGNADLNAEIGRTAVIHRCAENDWNGSILLVVDRKVAPFLDIPRASPNLTFARRSVVRRQAATTGD